MVKGYNVEGFKFISSLMEESEKRSVEEKVLKQEPESEVSNAVDEEWDFTPVGVWCGIPLLDLLDEVYNTEKTDDKVIAKPIEIVSPNGVVVLKQFTPDDSREIFDLI